MGKTILNKTGQDIEQLCEKKLAFINANPIIERTSIEDGIVRENTIYRLGTVTSAPVITAVENSYNESIIVFKTGPNVTHLNENNDSVNGLAVPQFIPIGYSLVGIPIKILEQDSSYVICYWNHLVIIKKLHDCDLSYSLYLNDVVDARSSFVVISYEYKENNEKVETGCLRCKAYDGIINMNGYDNISVDHPGTVNYVEPHKTFSYKDYLDDSYRINCIMTGLRIGSELDDFIPSRDFYDIPIEVDYDNQKLRINNDGFLIRTEGTTKKLCLVTTDSDLTSASKIDLTNSGITSLNQYPFINCSSLNELILPATINQIDEDSFIKRDNDGSLSHEDIIESVTFNGTIDQWENIDVTSYGPGGGREYWPSVIHCSDGDWVNTDRPENSNDDNEG